MKDYHDLFDQLLQGKLSESESKSLTNKIESDPKLKIEFDEYHSAFLVANLLERREIKSNVKDALKKDTIEKSGNGFWKKVLAFLLALLIISGLSYTYKSYFKTEKTPQQYASEYFSPYPDKVTSMGENELDLSAYNNGNYTQAILDLEKTEGFEAKFYSGISHLGNQEYTKAVSVFQSVKASTPNSYKKPLQWYMALAHLGSNNTKEAKQLLEAMIADPNSNYKKDDASKILKSI